jgi:2-polyprenyl-3-methyl-5-hydroxy-6-metoxy-1,4-benzoquinol methylase
MDQQDQALQYFRSAALDWQSKAVNAQGAYSVIEGRHRAVLAVLEDMAGAARFLDVGCGTGQLAIAVAELGLDAEGIDFAEAMVAQCRENARRAGVAVRFTCGSFFDVELEDGAYDVLSAQGFIEYISPDQTDRFFQRCARLLRPGGALVVGSRNRLFNAFSLNEFTQLEAEMGTLGALIAEARTLGSYPSPQAVFAALRRHERIDPQPDHHPVTGIPVETRYQYSPADLICRLRRCGLAPAALFPVHYHGFPPQIAGEQPELHSRIALAAAEFGLRDHRLIPSSSTFVLDARRER